LASEEVDPCDPLAELASVMIGGATALEVFTSRGLFWLDIEPQFPTVAEEKVALPRNERGDVVVTALQFEFGGNTCLASAQSAYVLSEGEWYQLRPSGLEEFSAKYAGRRFPVQRIRVGLNLLLGDRGMCDVAVKAIIRSPIPGFLTPYPAPDPGC
jgi:hypothetical protein